MFTELQATDANRRNPEFMHHIEMLKSTPSASELRQSALNSFNSTLDDLNLTTHMQAVLRGYLLNYAECERIIAEDRMRQPVYNTDADHALMIGCNAEKVIS